MKITIQAGINTYRIAGRTTPVDGIGVFQGRLLSELRITKQLARVGHVPITLPINIRNNDGYIASSVDLWGASVSVESDSGYTWQGKITAYDSDGGGIMYIVATEKTAPELLVKFPDEVARLVTVDENFHVSALNVTLPMVVGGTVEKPILVKGILIEKTAGIYLLCVGENHQIVNVYRGTEKLTSGYSAYTGTAAQENYPGFAYVQLTDESLRKNDDGTYVEVSAEVVGLKLGAHTIEECRNGARFLLWLLKTAREGAGGWGLGIAEGDIDTTAFTTAISRVDAAGLKMDGIFYFRQIAQSWIDQICQAIRGSYSIGSDGKRRLFVNAPAASRKTYTKHNIKLLRYGKGAYTGQVYNKGRLEFGYNPLVGRFTQSAQYEDPTSISDIDEQLFEGQSYLIREMATGKALVDYECKKSLIGATKVYFETKELPDDCREGDIITVTYPEKGISGDWQITHLDIGDRKHRIEAEKFSDTIFVSGTPGTAIDWSQDPPIVAPFLPGAPTGLDLSTVIDYDSAGDGAARPFIEGAFAQPEGKYLGAAVFWGEGTEPATWNSHGSIRGTSFRVGPVKSGQLYTVKVQLFNSSGASGAISATITPGKHADLPPTPTISVQPGFGCIVVSIGVEDFTALAEFEIQRRKSDGSGLTIVTQKHRSTRLVDDSPEILTSYTLAYQYQVRSVSNSRQYSAWSAWSDSVSPVQVQSKDITDLPIIGKQFLTAEGVGAEQDGVKFTAAGIEMWKGGARQVLIPATGDPEFSGILSARAGFIGECVIADGGLRSLDFVSQHRGWSISKTGEAEFNNLRARGSIETVVFKKDEVSVVGGRQMVRPAAVVAGYDYDAYLAEIVAARFAAYWLQLNSILDNTEIAPDFTCADYDDFYATELAYWMQLSGILATGVFATAIAEADLTAPTQQAQLAAYWLQLNSLLDQSITAPTFPFTGFAGYEQIELDGWMQLNDFLDYDVFEPAIGPNDIRLQVDDVGEFAIGDVVRVKDGLSDYWAVVDAVGADFIDISRRSGSRFAITPGQAVVNYGKAGSGGIMLDGQTPLIDLYTHQGEPWNGTDVHVRQGNLKGWGGITANVHGLAIGSPAGDYFLAIPGQGIIMNGAVNITRGSGIANLVDAGILARADDLDGVPDGAGYKRTTANEKTGAGRAYSGLDANNRLVTAVIPATAVSPSGSGLYMGSNYMGFYNSGWKTYMDNSGNFALVGSGTHGLSWNAGTGVLTISGSVTILGGSGYGNLSDKPTNLADINSTEGSKLTGIAAGADVTANNTAYDTARVAGTAAATVASNAANALANAATANGLLADIAADNKLVPSEKHSARKEWDIIAAEKAGINSQATTFGITTENTTYNNAFQALATYLNNGTTWSSGVPSWLADANLGTTTTIVGATFRTNWKTYYDARTALLNAITAKAKTIADVGSTHAGTAHAPSNADVTSTVISGGLVTTGTLQVAQGGTVAAGITGNTSGDTAVRIWAGSTFADRTSAPFRVLQNGSFYATKGEIAGFTIDGNTLKNRSALGTAAVVYMTHQSGDDYYITQLSPVALTMSWINMDTLATNSFSLNAKCQIVIEHGIANSVIYRKWSNGFIEQWGTLNSLHAIGSDLSVSLGVAFTTTAYKVVMSAAQRGAAASGAIWRARTNTTTAFKVYMDSFDSDGVGVSHSADWYACGY